MQEAAKLLVNNSIGLCFQCVRGCSCCIKLQIYRLQPAVRGGVNYCHGVSSSSPALELPPWGGENPWVTMITCVLGAGRQSSAPRLCSTRLATLGAVAHTCGPGAQRGAAQMCLFPPSRPSGKGNDWGQHLGTCFRDFLAAVELGKEKRDEEVRVGFTRGRWGR